MDSPTTDYRRHRFPPQIISHAVWLYHRFCLSFRDVEDLMAQRGVEVSYETIRPAAHQDIREKRVHNCVIVVITAESAARHGVRAPWCNVRRTRPGSWQGATRGGIVWIKWIGTHKDYDRIDAKEVEHGTS